MNETKHVLLIEDDQALRSVLADALRAEHVGVVEAKDGAEGVMEAERAMPDLILLDIVMPRMDGRAVFRSLRANEKTKQIPVSFLTNLSDLAVISNALGEERADYIVKSDWSIDEIVRHVKAKLGLPH